MLQKLTIYRLVITSIILSFSFNFFPVCPLSQKARNTRYVKITMYVNHIYISWSSSRYRSWLFIQDVVIPPVISQDLLPRSPIESTLSRSVHTEQGRLDFSYTQAMSQALEHSALQEGIKVSFHLYKFQLKVRFSCIIKMTLFQSRQWGLGGVCKKRAVVFWNTTSLWDPE